MSDKNSPKLSNNRKSVKYIYKFILCLIQKLIKCLVIKIKYQWLFVEVGEKCSY